MLSQSAGTKTLPLGLSGFLVRDVFIWGQLMAAALIATVPLVIIFIAMQRFIVGGLTIGGVKG